MRTTLDIADDVLQAAKERARRENKTAGEVISELVRQALTAPREYSLAVREPTPVYGFKPFAARGSVVTNDIINKLRNDDAY
ncbi:MAG: antitoxin [Gemmatimonadaceae bacterium]